MALHTIVEHDTTHIKPYIDNVKQAVSDEVSARAKLGAHNLLPLDLDVIKPLNIAGTWANNVYTINNGIITVNDDGTFTVNGTFSAAASFYCISRNTGKLILENDNYRMTGAVANTSLILVRKKSNIGEIIASDNGSGVNFTVNGDDDNPNKADLGFRMDVAGTHNNSSIKPMIRLATDTDTTYGEFTKTNVELTKDTEGLIENVENMGALNLSNNTAASTTMFNGNLTVTRNSDKTYTLNGNSTGAAATEYYPLSEYFEVEQGETYTISSGVTNDSYNTQRLWVDGTPFPSGYRLVSDAIEASDTRNTQVAQSTGTVRVVLYIYPNQTYSNVKIKPMVIKGKSKVFDYAPYAMSNGELTEAVEITELSSFTSYLGSTITTLFGNLIKRGKVVTINFYWEGSATNVQEIITLPSEYCPSTYRYGGGTVKLNEATEPAVYQITSDGKICQAKTGIACVGGSCSIVYSV